MYTLYSDTDALASGNGVCGCFFTSLLDKKRRQLLYGSSCTVELAVMKHEIRCVVSKSTMKKFICHVSDCQFNRFHKRIGLEIVFIF